MLPLEVLEENLFLGLFQLPESHPLHFSPVLPAFIFTVSSVASCVRGQISFFSIKCLSASLLYGHVCLHLDSIRYYRIISYLKILIVILCGNSLLPSKVTLASSRDLDLAILRGHFSAYDGEYSQETNREVRNWDREVRNWDRESKEANECPLLTSLGSLKNFRGH